jgi:hypothetical protein
VAVRLDVPDGQLLGIRAFARKVVKQARKRPIPYGVDYTHDAFDKETGDWLHGPTGRGLTCATFVVAMLACTGVQFLDVKNWSTPRPGDTAWVAHIVELLAVHDAKEQAEHILKNEKGLRIRPAEVAGAAKEPAKNWLVKFDTAVQRAPEIEASFNALIKPAIPSTGS